MTPAVLFAVSLALMGVAFALLHQLILLFGFSDLVALILFSAPVIGFIAYCTESTRAKIIRSALTIFCSFSAVIVSAALIVYLIGV